MIIAGTMRDAPLSPRELAAYDAPFRENVPGAAGQPHTTIEGGGHFLQETRADDFVKVIIDAIQPSNQQGVLP
jgi:pimeloyl-ACP methyl ester carboxylesterase